MTMGVLAMLTFIGIVIAVYAVAAVLGVSSST